MAKKIRLDMVTPEKVAYSGEIDMLIARTLAGDIGILPGHAPLIAAMSIWPVRIFIDGKELLISVCRGFIEVKPDRITLLADCAELPEEIDVDRAHAAKDRAEARLKTGIADIDVTRAELALKRAIVRLKVAGHNRI